MNDCLVFFRAHPHPTHTHAPRKNQKIRHYRDHALSIIMAAPSENPVLAANFQFVFAGVRGADSAVEALRAALLGVAAVHQSFLLSRSGVSQPAADEARRVAGSFRAKAQGLLAAACATREGCANDAALASAVAIALIDVSRVCLKCFEGNRCLSASLFVCVFFFPTWCAIDLFGRPELGEEPRLCEEPGAFARRARAAPRPE